MQDAVQRRVAHLSEAAQHALTVAAVIGQQVSFALLQAVTASSEATLLAHIKEWLAAQLVVELSAARFALRHALTRQAIYQGLLARERQALHQQIGETLERLEGDAFASLAYHFDEAGAWTQALAYARRAADQAQALDTPRAAIEQLTRALRAAQQLAETPPLPGLYRDRGLAYETIGDFEVARADLETVQQLAEAAADRRLAWRALLDLGKLWAARNYGETGRYFQQALDLARTLDDPETVARSLNRLGNWQLNNGAPRQGIAYHQEALTLFETLGDQAGLATTLDLLGMSGWLGADFVQGRAYYERAVALFEALGNRQGQVLSLAGLVGCGSDASIDTTVHAATAFAECEPQGALAARS